MALIVVGSLLLVKAILTPKHRRRLPLRLGYGLDRQLAGRKLPAPRLWFHALSVGEVASSRSLVKAMRAALPDAAIIFSTTTESGARFAEASLAAEVDCFIPFPLDFKPSVARFIQRLAPDLFVLVETDFWPNFLDGLRRRGIPALLVNGRISARSFASYHRFRIFFRPLFRAFAAICTQTAEDAERLVALGVSGRRVITLGNLKYEAVLPALATAAVVPEDFGLVADRLLWVAGSTHVGEEEVVLRVYRRLLPRFPDLQLVLAPRQVERGERIAALADREGLSASRRSRKEEGAALLILDTIGELAALYRFCDVAFIGGSLVAAGGHNPLEPAAFFKPVLFGPHMEDFGEVSRDLLEVGGAFEVTGEEELFQRLCLLLADSALRRECGGSGGALVQEQRGVTDRHVALILELLSQGKGGG
ncbi:MAG: 3-deoxy-D-manno-octulosonic acid transferase [Desulfobulbaceae bacterium]|nr:3-deoxy-D-manno-octulosonic acid transferase [Desulfobulbaceae bacterium]